MKRVLVTIVLLVVVTVGGGVALWTSMYPTYSYRYRLTLEVEVDGKIRSGSSVIEIVWSGGPTIGDVGPYHPRIRGQAASVDIAPHGVLIAVLTNGESYGPASDGALSAIWLAAQAFGNSSTNDELPALPRLKGRRHLSPQNMPRLIWLSDISNPSTARKIRSSEFPELLGPNTRLVDAFVEITEDPIVIDIDKKLPWYADLAARQKSMGIISRPSEFHLSYPMFIGE